MQRAASCKDLFSAKSCLQRLAYNSPLSDIILFLWNCGQRFNFCNFFLLIQSAIFLEWKVSTWVHGIFLLTVLVACFHIWAEPVTIISMPTKIQIIMCNSANPFLLRPVLGQPQIQYYQKQSSLYHGYSLVIMQLAFPLW